MSCIRRVKLVNLNDHSTFIPYRKRFHESFALVNIKASRARGVIYVLI